MSLNNETQVEARRQHPHDRLRQDDVQEDLKACHSKREPGIPLATADRDDPGPESFRIECGDVAGSLVPRHSDYDFLSGG